MAAVVVFLLANRSSARTIVGGLRTPNTALWLVLGGAVALLGVVLEVPFARRTFRFGPVDIGVLLLSIAAGLACTMWFDLLKLTRHWASGHPARGA